MSALLADLRDALAYCIRHEVDVCPDALRENARTLAALESADAQERLLACADDAERVELCRAWLASYRASW